MTIGERVKRRRKEMHLSQTELAAQLGYADKSAISKIESSGDSISIIKLRKLSQALMVPISYFIGDLSDRAYQIALAYDAADRLQRAVVDVALDFELEKEDTNEEV